MGAFEQSSGYPAADGTHLCRDSAAMTRLYTGMIALQQIECEFSSKFGSKIGK
jgi:hypothetical protein